MDNFCKVSWGLVQALVGNPNQGYSSKGFALRSPQEFPEPIPRIALVFSRGFAKKSPGLCREFTGKSPGSPRDIPEHLPGGFPGIHAKTLGKPRRRLASWLRFLWESRQSSWGRLGQSSEAFSDKCPGKSCRVLGKPRPGPGVLGACLGKCPGESWQIAKTLCASKVFAALDASGGSKTLCSHRP